MTVPGVAPKSTPVWTRPDASVVVVGETRVASPETTDQATPMPAYGRLLSRASNTSGWGTALRTGADCPSPETRTAERESVEVTVKSTDAVGSSVREARTTTGPAVGPKSTPVWARPAVSVVFVGDTSVASPETMLQLIPMPGVGDPLSLASTVSGVVRACRVGPTWPPPPTDASVRTTGGCTVTV